MRTLKKTLCMVLVLAMMVGVCAFSANAAFPDEAEIVNKEAVDLLTGIGVISGMGDGTFNPKGTLTRAMAAKIICYLLGYQDVAGAVSTFTDVPATHWAAGPIALCATQGIVNGYGDGRFGPDDLLTTEAWEKMLLCALGFNAEQEGMSGSAWEIGVARLTKLTDLAQGTSLNPLGQITRDDACKLAYNALTVPEVAYTGGLNVSTSDGTTISQDSNCRTTGTYLAQNFGLSVMYPTGGAATGADTKNYAKQAFNNAGANRVVFDGVITQNSANSTEDTTTLGGIGAFNVKTGLDLLGHYVRIYQGQKPGADGKKPVYSIVDLSTVKSVGRAAITTATNWTKTFGATDQYAALPASTYQFVQGTMPTYAATSTVGALATTGITIGTRGNANTTYVFSRNATGKLVLQAEIFKADSVVTLDKVTAINNTSGKETITFAGANVLSNGKLDASNNKLDVVNEYEGIAVGDIVTISKVGPGLDGTTYIYNVEKAKTVTGSISAVSKAVPTAGALTIDGKAYMPSGAALSSAAALDATVAGGAVEYIGTPWASLDATQLKGNTYTLYLDPNGDYIACSLSGGTAVASDALYAIYNYSKSESTTYGDMTKYYVQVTDASGKIDSVCIGARVGATNYGTTAGVTTGRLYTFKADTSVDANTVKYGYQTPNQVGSGAPASIGAVKAEFVTGAGTTAFKTSTTKVATTSGTAYINSSTNFVFVTGTAGSAKATVRAGLTVTQTLNNANTLVLYTKDADGNRIAKAVFYAGAYADTAPDAAKVLFLANNTASGTSASGTTYAAYKADTGERITITCGATGGPDQAGAAFYTYTENDGIYRLTWLDPATVTSVKVGQPFRGKLNNSILAGAPDGNGGYAISADTTSAIFVDGTIPGDDLSSLGALVTYRATHATDNLTISTLLDAKGKAVFVITTAK